MYAPFALGGGGSALLSESLPSRILNYPLDEEGKIIVRTRLNVKKLEKSPAAQFIGEMIDIYVSKRIPRSAAELSYFITLSVFPTLICVHAMLMNFLPGVELPMDELGRLIPQGTLTIIEDYIKYLSTHNNQNLLTAGIIGMATTSAAAFRSIHSTMADIQGKSRFPGIFALIFSFFFSLIFLAVIYFSAIVMVTGDWLIRAVTNLFPLLRGLELWSLIRFPLLFVIFIFMIYALYRITAPKNLKGGFLFGAFMAASVLLVVSVVFSWFISMSSRYPLIYGSLASIIIFMLWMYTCGQILYMGNALNVVIRHRRSLKLGKTEVEDGAE